MSEPRVQPLGRNHFRHFLTLNTRWMDNDVYGHLNNVVYYSLFDTVVNRSLMERGALDPQHGDVIGLVVYTQCHYFAPLSFPQDVQAGLSVLHAGRSSVRYRIGLFASGSHESAAHGEFVHVYVDRATRRPVALPEPLRAALQSF